MEMKMNRFEAKATSFSPSNLAYMAHCANLAYLSDSEIEIGLKSLGFNFSRDRLFLFSKNTTDTQCFVACDSEKIIISFRGSERSKIKDWITDAQAMKTLWPTGNPFCCIHHGFCDALTDIFPQIFAKIIEMRQSGQSVWFTGHSLGGALAVLAAAATQIEQQQDVNGVYAFGAPRVGDAEFANHYEAQLKDRTYCVVNNNDVVTRVPTRLSGYCDHLGNLLYFSSKGELHRNDSMSLWGKFWDRMEGGLERFLEFQIDGIEDHRMNTYQKLCEKVAGWR
jgi:triacylglycerol lipase